MVWCEGLHLRKTLWMLLNLPGFEKCSVSFAIPRGSGGAEAGGVPGVESSSSRLGRLGVKGWNRGSHQPKAWHSCVVVSPG